VAVVEKQPITTEIDLRADFSPGFDSTGSEMAVPFGKNQFEVRIPMLSPEQSSLSPYPRRRRSSKSWLPKLHIPAIGGKHQNGWRPNRTSGCHAVNGR
jgi:hypothetical protein